MVLGDGEAGKTTLLETLCSGGKSRMRNVQTDGIELRPFILKVRTSQNPKAVKVKIHFNGCLFSFF